ncbi:hypothetical protein HOY82DRAFT_610604 [Tuber indicum]|nr:hypothetical protein HOY82DRAFT_610604 [Tuber indicum]
MRDLGSGDGSKEPADPPGSIKMGVTAFPKRTIFINPATGDSILITVTDTGQYSDSILRFNEKTCIQSIHVLLSTLKNIVLVSIGTDHVNGLTREGNVYEWAMHKRDGLDGVVILVPTVVEDLKGFKVVQISTGEHRSAAWTTRFRHRGSHGQGVVYDASGKPHCLSTTHVVLGIKFPFIGFGECHIIAISGEGRTASLGFGGRYRTGLRPAAEDEIKFPTEIENASTRGIMVFSDAGGHFPILAEITPKHTNGTV